MSVQCRFLLQKMYRPVELMRVAVCASVLLLQVRAPGGDSLAAKVTIHAGKYAGAVVGRSAWTYE